MKVLGIVNSGNYLVEVSHAEIEKALGQERYNQLWLSVFKDARMESLGFGHS